MSAIRSVAHIAHGEAIVRMSRCHQVRHHAGAVAELVGIEGGVVSGVINLESSGVEASDWRLRHDQAYHEA
jgi:hypothetical protein